MFPSSGFPADTLNSMFDQSLNYKISNDRTRTQRVNTICSLVTFPLILSLSALIIEMKVVPEKSHLPGDFLIASDMNLGTRFLFSRKSPHHFQQTLNSLRMSMKTFSNFLALSRSSPYSAARTEAEMMSPATQQIGNGKMLIDSQN